MVSDDTDTQVFLEDLRIFYFDKYREKWMYFPKYY